LRLSVVIPAFNAGRFLGDAIRSVLAQHTPIEIVVVDDGSSDATAGIARSFGAGVRLIQHGTNRGLPSAQNTGVAAASGDLIGFLDADDVWLPGKAAHELRLLGDSDIDIGWGLTQVRFLDEGATQERESPDWPVQRFPALGSMLFRRRVFDRIGPFDAGLRHGQDIDFLARAQEAGMRFAQHDRIVLSWRRHGANMTNAIALDRDFMATVVRRALQRRRAGEAA
jgi:glycosyltransferase involved in cell wall biosynthesis